MSEGGEARSGKHPESVRTGEGETFGERAERLGGEARNHEAVEVEAVGRALADLANARDREEVRRGDSPRHVPLNYEDWRAEYDEEASAAIAALDAVRRSPEGVPFQPTTTDVHSSPPVRSPQREDPDGGFDSAAGETHSWPQGEDHEHSWQPVWRCRHCDLVQPPAPSPERDTEKLVKAATEASKAMRLYNRNGLSWMELDAVFARLDRVLAGGSSTTEE